MKKTIGERIQALRIDNDINQEEFAKHIGVARSTLANYEINKVKNIPIEVLVKCADIFDTTVDYLVGRTENPNFKITEKADVKIVHNKEVFFTDDDIKKVLELAKLKDTLGDLINIADKINKFRGEQE